MLFWRSKRSGQPATGGGCIGCIPIPLGCLSGLAIFGMAFVWFIA
jgi:hypothetical protein